jgi:hypothetical protein
VTEPLAELVIRPRSGGAADRVRLRFAFAFLPIVLLGVVRQFHGGLNAGLWYLAGLLTLVLIGLALRADFFAETSIHVASEAVGRTGYFGRSARCPRADISRVVEVSAVVSRLGGIPATWLLFLDAHNRTLLRAYAEYYPTDELSRLRAALDVDWEVVPGARTFAEVRRAIPASFPWALAHFWVTLALVTATGLVLAGLIAGIT